MNKKFLFFGLTAFVLLAGVIYFASGQSSEVTAVYLYNANSNTNSTCTLD